MLTGPASGRGCPSRTRQTKEGNRPQNAPSPILQKRKLRLRGYSASSKVSEVGSDRNGEPREPEQGDTTGQRGGRGGRVSSV